MNWLKTGIMASMMMLFIASAVAQNPNTQAPSPDEQIEAAKYEQYYEILLDNTLNEYYKAGTFIVDVKADVDRVLVPKGYEVVEELPPLEIENLPGVPIIPPSLRSTRQGRDSLRISGFDARFRLNKIDVKVLVDTSYSSADVDFVREAVAMIANVDRFRGDVVTVETKVFPRSTRDIPVSKPTDEGPILPLNEVEDQSSQPNEFLGVDWNDPKQLLYVIVGLIALLLFVVLFFAFRKPKPEPTFDPGIPVQSQFAGHGEEVKPVYEDEVREIAADKQTKFEEDRTYITNTSISHPKMVADLVTQWVATEDEEGVVKAVRSLYSTDPKLLEVMQAYMDPDHYEKIEFGLSNVEHIPVKEKAEETEKFRKAIQQLKASKEKGDNGGNLFDFLNQLTDQQLLHLIKGESEEMTAILLAQVAGERAGYALQKMEEQKRVSVLLKMGKISNIPVSIYKRVASHFSTKALSVSDMKYVAADGLESILSTIDSLPISEQEAYVSSIAEKDINLAKRIRKLFVSFDDIPGMDEGILQAATESIGSEVLIVALRGAKDNVIAKLLVVRGKREQQLIKSELSNPEEVKASEVEKARKEILMAIRNYLKTIG